MLLTARNDCHQHALHEAHGTNLIGCRPLDTANISTSNLMFRQKGKGSLRFRPVCWKSQATAGLLAITADITSNDRLLVCATLTVSVRG